MNTIHDLVMYFLQATQANMNNQYQYSENTRLVNQYIEKGWTLDLLKKEIDTFALEQPFRMPHIFFIGDIIGNKKPNVNLVADFYGYHNELRYPFSPTRIKMLESGDFVRIGGDSEIRYKEEYYISDLLNYFYKKTKQSPNEFMIRRDEGKATYLLKEFDVDEMLFAIDIAVEDYQRNHRKFADLFDIKDYIERARNGIKRKRNQERLLRLEE